MSRLTRLILWILSGVVIGAVLSVLYFVWMLSSLLNWDRDIEEVAADAASGTAATAIQALPLVDFAAGPVDLILDEGGRRWLVQDQDIVRKAAVMAMPDGLTKPPRSIIGVVFSDKRRSDKNEFTITLVRNGETLSQQTCWTVDCADRPEVESFLDSLLGAGQQLQDEYESFEDYGAYLRAHARVSAAADRYGELDPPQPEPELLFRENLYITFPIVFFHESGPSVSLPDYEAAFRQEYAADAGNFTLALGEVEIGDEFSGLMLRRCHDQGVVMRRADSGVVFPAGWHFVSVGGWIRATSDFADELEAREEWDFLPSPANDSENLNRSIQNVVAEQSDMVDPQDCYTVDGTSAGDQLTLWRDMPWRYGFHWVRIVGKEVR